MMMMLLFLLLLLLHSTLNLCLTSEIWELDDSRCGSIANTNHSTELDFIHACTYMNSIKIDQVIFERFLSFMTIEQPFKLVVFLDVDYDYLQSIRFTLVV